MTKPRSAVPGTCARGRREGRDDHFLAHPENGGTSLGRSLSGAYGTRVFDHNRDPNWTYGNSLEELEASYDVIHGHINLDRTPHLLKGMSFIFTFLRDPVERVLSSYFYHAHPDTDNELGRRVRDTDMTVREFADLPGQQDLQFRMVRPVGRENINFYGFVERYSASLRGLSEALSVDLVETSANVNRTWPRRFHAPYEIDAALRAFIRDRNRKDIDLYQWAWECRRSDSAKI